MGSGVRRAHLIELIQARGLSVRHLLRETDTPYTELGLADEKWSGDELIDLMVAHPILINRPIVETPLGVRLCRPFGEGPRDPAKHQHWPLRQGRRRGRSRRSGEPRCLI